MKQVSKRSGSLAAVVAVAGCAGGAGGAAAPAGLGEEVVLEGEERHIAEAIEITRELMAREREASGSPSRRALFNKHHGCVYAKFAPEPDRPPETRHGVLAGDAPYDAWIRFANAGFSPRPDTEGAGRAMAMKLLGVEGPKLLESEAGAKTQDFLFVSHPTFVVKDTASHNELLRDTAGYTAKHPDTALTIATIRAKKVSSPLEIRYWSMTAYRLGPRAVKLSMVPDEPPRTEIPEAPGPDYLAEAMERHLAEREARFRLMVQLQRDPVRQPIEDPTVEWIEAEAPFVHVATITIPKQRFRSPERDAFCQGLSFTPWHSLPEHRPLGNVNRARKAIYEALSRERRAGNGAPLEEPTRLVIPRE